MKTIDTAKTAEKAAALAVYAEKCTGCLRCQMICSLTFYDRINPELADIRIERDPAMMYRYRVGFAQECRSGCRLCAKHCPYDCLVAKTRGGEEQ